MIDDNEALWLAEAVLEHRADILFWKGKFGLQPVLWPGLGSLQQEWLDADGARAGRTYDAVVFVRRARRV